jgi:hypothetical protein
LEMLTAGIVTGGLPDASPEIVPSTLL